MWLLKCIILLATNLMINQQKNIQPIKGKKILLFLSSQSLIMFATAISVKGEGSDLCIMAWLRHSLLRTWTTSYPLQLLWLDKIMQTNRNGLWCLYASMNLVDTFRIYSDELTFISTTYVWIRAKH